MAASPSPPLIKLLALGLEELLSAPLLPAPPPPPPPHGLSPLPIPPSLP